MKKLISLILVMLFIFSFTSVYADNYENKVYSFDAVSTTATFDKEGTSLNIDGEAVLAFDEPTKMTLAGEADNVFLVKIALQKYDSSEIVYEFDPNYLASAVVFTKDTLGTTELVEGAYSLVLSIEETEQGSSVIIIVGDPEIKVQNQPNKVPTAFREGSKISDWALNELNEAYDSSLITVELFNNGDYQRNITRGEFAHVMAELLKQCGVSYDDYVASLGEKPTYKFTDTNNDIAIEFVSHCGVINGVSETLFDPSGELTREQAAAMLARTVTYVKPNLSKETVAAFADEAQFSDWAKDSIYTVAGIKDSISGYAVMAGMGDGIFSPQTGYTVEQALIATKRLLRALS